MSGLRVPAKRAQHPNAGRDFPEGLWLIELEETRLNTIDPAANPKLEWAFKENANGKVKYRGRNAEEVSLQWGNATALQDGQEDAGNQKLFTRITVRDGATTIDKVDLDNAGHVGYGIVVDAALYTNLALALGEAYEQDGYVYPSDDFLEKLRAGAYKGFKVIAKVKHRRFTRRDGSPGLEVEVEEFSPAA